MAQSAELLVRVVRRAEVRQLFSSVVGRRRAIVALQAILLQLMTGSAGAGLAHRYGAMAAGDEFLAVRHLLPLVTDLAGVCAVAKVTQFLARLVPMRLAAQVGCLCEVGGPRAVALLTVALPVALGAGLRIGPCRLTVWRSGPTARVRHRQLMARLHWLCSWQRLQLAPRAALAVPCRVSQLPRCEAGIWCSWQARAELRL